MLSTCASGIILQTFSLLLHGKAFLLLGFSQHLPVGATITGNYEKYFHLCGPSMTLFLSSHYSTSCIYDMPHTSLVDIS